MIKNGKYAWWIYNKYFLFCILCVMKNRSALRSYFWIVSVLSIWGCTIAAGILLYNLGSKLLITDQEYLVWSHRSYELSNCDAPEWKWEKSVERTPESKEACKKEATQRILDWRWYDLKSGMILWWVWLIICLIIYWFHYSKLKKLNESDFTIAS